MRSPAAVLFPQKVNLTRQSAVTSAAKGQGDSSLSLHLVPHRRHLPDWCVAISSYSLSCRGFVTNSVYSVGVDHLDF